MMKCIMKKIGAIVGWIAAYIGGTIAVGITWGGPEAGMLVCFGMPVLIFGLSVTLAIIETFGDCNRCKRRNAATASPATRL